MCLMNDMNEILLSNHLAVSETTVAGKRLPNLIDAPPDSNKILRASKVAVIGCGAIGRSIALHFARLNIRKLWLVDKKKIKKESLLTHAVVPQEISMPKATNLGRLVKTISPETRVFAYDGPVEMLDLMSFGDADLVILATDNLNAEIMVGQRCLWRPICLSGLRIFPCGMAGFKPANKVCLRGWRSE